MKLTVKQIKHLIKEQISEEEAFRNAQRSGYDVTPQQLKAFHDAQKGSSSRSSTRPPRREEDVREKLASVERQISASGNASLIQDWESRINARLRAAARTYIKHRNQDTFPSNDWAREDDEFTGTEKVIEEKVAAWAAVANFILNSDVTRSDEIFNQLKQAYSTDSTESPSLGSKLRNFIGLEEEIRQTIKEEIRRQLRNRR
jgi:hypothetical protein